MNCAVSQHAGWIVNDPIVGVLVGLGEGVEDALGDTLG